MKRCVAFRKQMQYMGNRKCLQPARRVRFSLRIISAFRVVSVLPAGQYNNITTTWPKLKDIINRVVNAKQLCKRPNNCRLRIFIYVFSLPRYIIIVTQPIAEHRWGGFVFLSHTREYRIICRVHISHRLVR